MLQANELIEGMANDMGMLQSHLLPIIRTAPLRYKVFYIKKKSGALREVAQPAREVKSIQYWIMQKLEGKIPVHGAATAYCSGSSIKKNALAHVNSHYLLKLDFRNFFPSILAEDIERHLEVSCPDEFDSSARKLISRVCCWAPKRTRPLRLCIGAPSSPMLSNSIMHAFDAQISALAERDSVTYTRYADDLTLSSKRAGVLAKYPELISEIVRQLEYPTLALNDGKTVFASRAGLRLVTGITLTPDHSLSIGRERKRVIRAMFHRNSMGLLNADEQEKLAGLLAFADSIEPGFSARLTKEPK